MEGGRINKMKPRQSRDKCFPDSMLVRHNILTDYFVRTQHIKVYVFSAAVLKCIYFDFLFVLIT